MRNSLFIAWCFLVIIGNLNSQNTGNSIDSGTDLADFWLTKADESVKLEKQQALLKFGKTPNSYSNIEVKETEVFQTVEGFGYTLTGGSAQVINRLTPDRKQELLKELFGSGENDISISYIRISIGASDLSETAYSYNDLPEGRTDMNLKLFSIAPEMTDMIPVLKQILMINPRLKIIASPWSAPVWMKDNNSTIGGSLQTRYYGVYARYFVNYIQKMQEQGIPIDAITPQNEPLHRGNNPSMYMSVYQQAEFIRDHLGPAFGQAGINTKIIIYDHNCDEPGYPIEVLNDPGAKAFITGSAFHLYGGDVSAMSIVKNAHPDKEVYFTEQWTSSGAEFGPDLRWHLQNVIIGSMRNWSKIALEWNLANDASFGPHTPGGCNQCQGAITVNNSTSFSRNVSYYIIAHASKFVSPDSQRIASTSTEILPNVAFKRPDGRKVLIVLNNGNMPETFNVKYNEKWFTTSLEGGAVGTYVW
ncbi:MAG: glycoside hydrolase family 30 beta sandwich domain-containing protein [Flavobacteriaceae bacterium]|nr:glycoside hydrolase family 30 beta sandwich domain-containing protein [Flavobacteriaceae bacterium]